MNHNKDNSNDGTGYSRSNGGDYKPPRPVARGGSSGFRPRANSTHTSVEPSSSQVHFFSDH
ncbi:hypothetical protein RDI58_021950 [Solanum bulbocastanum]|uniref:Uncharacterized protein n=1 Tax=Solanum bulbocastanum TaxID=147425 RepID=A0AAN8T9P5_SOLBU